MLGMILLTQGQLWRNSAEFYSPITCGFPRRATRVMVRAVTGISSKLPVTNCQNRYPSPSKRSDLSQVRPLLLWIDGLLSAVWVKMTKKCLDQRAETSNYAHAKQFQMREGRKKCLKKPGSSGWLQWWVLRPVLITTLNVALQVRRRVPSLQMLLVSTRLPVPLSVAAPGWYVTTSGFVTDAANRCVSALILKVKSAIGEISPVAFCCCGTLSLNDRYLA